MKKKVWLHEMRAFLILWSSQMLSSLGSSMTSFALILWVYQQAGTATSVSMLSLFTYLPSILLCMAAGTLSDRWDKKRIMLVSDLVAAMGTATVFVLFSLGRLQVWHLYLVNFLISLMNAFQNPASEVATSLLVPKAHYVRANGLQSFANAVVSILTPSLAAAVLAFGGLRAVLVFDLATFAVAFLCLLLFIRLPAVQAGAARKQPFLRGCTEGVHFLRGQPALLHMILFFAFVNLLAYMTGFGILPVMILARSGNNQAVMGAVETALGLGTLAGSILVTVLRPAKNRVRTVFLACGLSFLLCNPALAVGRGAPVWVAAAFLGYVPLPFVSANMSAILRTSVPIAMQGRVFSTRNTLQFATIPLGLFLGGFLADHVFEPLMLGPSPLQAALVSLVGTGAGSGMAVMFLLTGVAGCLGCLLSLRDPAYRTLRNLQDTDTPQG